MLNLKTNCVRHKLCFCQCVKWLLIMPQMDENVSSGSHVLKSVVVGFIFKKKEILTTMPTKRADCDYTDTMASVYDFRELWSMRIKYTTKYCNLQLLHII
ncbi:hypothetical protein CHUAL_013600 [Chamberlinius hualienensis]